MLGFRTTPFLLVCTSLAFLYLITHADPETDQRACSAQMLSRLHQRSPVIWRHMFVVILQNVDSFPRWTFRFASASCNYP